MPFRIVGILYISVEFSLSKLECTITISCTKHSFLNNSNKGYKKIAFKNIYTYVVGSLPRLSCN